MPCPGTTCLVALLSDRELTVANVGDSRGVLCDKDGNAVALSHDHKPYQLKERKRIKRAGKIRGKRNNSNWWMFCLKERFQTFKAHFFNKEYIIIIYSGCHNTLLA